MTSETAELFHPVVRGWAAFNEDGGRVGVSHEDGDFVVLVSYESAFEHIEGAINTHSPARWQITITRHMIGRASASDPLGQRTTEPSVVVNFTGFKASGNSFFVDMDHGTEMPREAHRSPLLGPHAVVDCIKSVVARMMVETGA